MIFLIDGPAEICIVISAISDQILAVRLSQFCKVFLRHIGKKKSGDILI